MPTTFEIPSRRERHCEPCEFHKSIAACRGGPGNVWDLWVCKHPAAYDDQPLSEVPEIAQKQMVIRARCVELGRTIGRTYIQPQWCPLLRQERNP